MRKIPIPKAKIDPVYNSWNVLKKKLAKNIKKLSSLTFLAVPLSTKAHHVGLWYVHINFSNQDQVVFS